MKRSSNFAITTCLTNELSEFIIDEVAEFYSVGFSGQPYFHFAINEKNPLIPLSPGLDFHGWERSNLIKNEKQKRSVQSTLMKEARQSAQSWYSETELSEIDLPAGYYRWSDPVTVRSIMRDRFQDPGYVTIVRDKETQAMRGLLHARMANFQRLFHTEEWYNPFLFGRYHNESLLDDPRRFFKELKDSLGFTAQSNTMIISAQLLHPAAYGGDVFFDMMYDMASRVTASHRTLPLVAEIPEEGTAHVFNVAASDKLFTNILANGHPFIYTEKTEDALSYFLRGKRHWYEVLRAEVKRRRCAA